MQKPSFYWGVGLENCWMAEHNEQNRSPKRLLDVFLQMQHYPQWLEDLEKAADLGINAIRYSIPWYKANPKPGVYDWSLIEKPLDYLVNKRNITPIIDLIHYGTPLWMENGVYNHGFPQYIAEYASAFAQEFKGLINHFTPHNEPQISALYGGFNSYWPPYLVGLDGWVKVGVNVAKGMVLSSQAIRSELPDSVLISADCQVSPGPDLVKKQLCLNIAAEEEDDFNYRVKTFPASLAYGKVEQGTPFGIMLESFGITKDDLRWFTSNKQLPDIVGHNYYPMLLEDQSGSIENCIVEGKTVLKNRLLRAYRFFERPIYISESSGGEKAEEKVLWMNSVAEVIEDLRKEDIPIVGFNWWPLYETIQWEYRDNSKSVMECIYNGGWNNGLYLIKEQVRNPVHAGHRIQSMSTSESDPCRPLNPEHADQQSRACRPLFREYRNRGRHETEWWTT